jgi:hypothetical protein
MRLGNLYNVTYIVKGKGEREREREREADRYREKLNPFSDSFVLEESHPDSSPAPAPSFLQAQSPQMVSYPQTTGISPSLRKRQKSRKSLQIS